MHELEQLEHSLWDTTTRFDRNAMETLFADDFFEFGRSGRRYTRSEMLFDEKDRLPIRATLHNLTYTHLNDDLVLVTYQSQVGEAGAQEWANRSSIWDKRSGKWQLRFHQGTPTEALT